MSGMAPSFLIYSYPPRSCGYRSPECSFLITCCRAAGRSGSLISFHHFRVGVPLGRSRAISGHLGCHAFGLAEGRGLSCYSLKFVSLDFGMSQVADSEDFSFVPPTPPRGGSELGNSPSLRSWTVPRLMAELRRKGIPFPSSARKAELFRLCFPPLSQSSPATSAEHATVHNALVQVHALLNTLATSMVQLQERMEVMEARA